jgi:hypothetical protein
VRASTCKDTAEGFSLSLNSEHLIFRSQVLLGCYSGPLVSGIASPKLTGHNRDTSCRFLA